MLEELVKKYKDENLWGPWLLDELSENTPARMLNLAREYNKEKNPCLEASEIMANVTINYEESRVFNADETKEMMMAYQKCAQNLSQASRKETDKEKLKKINSAFNALRFSMEHIMHNHKETAGAALDIYDKYMSDRGSYMIEAISACMGKNLKIWKKGFHAIHKIVIKETMKAQRNNEDNPELSCSKELRDILRKLWYTSSSEESITKVADEYTAFEKNLDEKKLPAPQEEIKGVHCYLDGTEEFDNYAALLKYIVKISMKKVMINHLAKTQGKNNIDVEMFTSYYGTLSADYDTPFKVIYKEYMEKYKDELERLKLQDQQKKKSLQRLKKQEKVAWPDLDIDLIYAGTERPKIENVKAIVPYNPYGKQRDENPSKPQEGGLWTSPMRENDKSEWQNWIEENSPEIKQKVEQRWHIVPTKDCRILVVDNFDKLDGFLNDDKRINFDELAKNYDLLYVPFECGSWNDTFYMWDVKTGFFMNAKNKDGKPLFHIFDDEEYKRYKIEMNKEKVARLRREKGDPFAAKKVGYTEANKMVMQKARRTK